MRVAMAISSLCPAKTFTCFAWESSGKIHRATAADKRRHFVARGYARKPRQQQPRMDKHIR